MRRRRLRWRIGVSIVLVAGLVAPVAVSWSYWSGAGESVRGPARAGAATVSGGAAPTVGTAGTTTAVLTWGASTLSTGRSVNGYLVRRYDANTGVVQAAGSGCTGLVTALSCSEAGLSPGQWTYTVTPRFGDHWAGTESAKSGSVTTGTATLTLAEHLFGVPLPTSTTGSVTGFAPGEAIALTLDDSTSITAAPTQVGADGTATITSVAIPDMPDGPHTVNVVGATSGIEASAGILVDTTAPILTANVTPAPNAAGWNRTPVEVSGSVDDGTGSGLDFVKSTTDGSDPRTSPTAQLYEGVPAPLDGTTTVKYYGVDRAGNETPVQTLEVKIDMIPPGFFPQMVDVTGGAVITTAPPNPGVAFYRGVDAGSFRFLITMLDTGGSGVATIGTSALIDVTTGFTHEPGSSAVPGGGAVLTNPFTWVAGTTSTPLGNVTVTDVAGNTSTGGGTLYNDSTPPQGGAVTATGVGGPGGGFSNSTTVDLVLDRGTDDASGLAPGARLLRSSAPLTSSDGVANGVCGTYGAPTQVGADDPAALTADTVPEDDRCYRYAYTVADRVGNVSTSSSSEVKVQAAAPATLTPSDVQITPVSGLAAQYVSGSTVFYRSALAGSFSVATSASDAHSGVAWVSFPNLDGFSGGGAVAPQDGGGTTFRMTYGWSANTGSPSPGGQTLSATGGAGFSPGLSDAFAVAKDDTAPTGGAVEVGGLGGLDGSYSTSTTLSLTLDPGADAGSGLAPTGRQLSRASASLTSDGASNGSCGTFGAYTPIGAQAPTSPTTDTVPVDRTCYRYRYAVVDQVGNQAISTSEDVKVEAVAPAPTLSFSDLSNASATGNAVFYRPAAASGGFTVTATGPDTTSGTTGYGFPTLAAGWTGSSGGSTVHRYAWSAPNPTAPAPGLLVTATNNAGGRSSTAFTVTASPDGTPPAGGTVSYTNGYSTNAAVNVSFTKGNDAGSGLASASGILQRSSATLSGGACGTFGAFTTVATNPTSAYSDTVTTACHRYRYLISDNVGNQAVYTTPSIVKIDQVAPTNTVSVANATGAASASGGAVVYYKGNAPGTFRFVNAVADGESGPGSTDFPDIATTGWTHAAETTGAPTGGPYVSSTFSWTANPSVPTLKSIVGRDVAGKAWSAAITFTNDVSQPTGGGIDYTNGIVNAASVPVTVTDGTDTGSGVGTTVITRDVATLTTTTETCGTFAGTYATTVSLAGGADTGVVGGHCYHYRFVVTDRVGNVTTYTSASVVKVDTSGPHVTAIASHQANGTTGNGQLQVGDRLVLTFNQSLAPASVPTTFSGATEEGTSVFDPTLLNIPGITNGPVSTGNATYAFLSRATFGGTIVLAGSGTATTVTITVTSLSGGTLVASNGVLAFAPAPTIHDGGGNSATGTFSTASTFRLF